MIATLITSQNFKLGLHHNLHIPLQSIQMPPHHKILSNVHLAFVECVHIACVFHALITPNTWQKG